MLQFIDLILLDVHYSQDQNNKITMNYVIAFLSICASIYAIYNYRKITENFSEKSISSQRLLISIYFYVFVVIIIMLIKGYQFICNYFE
jgi:uncharacterized membrane protein